MQRADALVRQPPPTSTLPTPVGSTSKPSSDAAALLVNAAFERITCVCTAWKQAAVGDPRAWAANYKRELLESLVRVGVRTAEEIDNGMLMLKERRSEFMPNPDRFAEMCFDHHRLGIPATNAAYRMACVWKELPRAEKHPAVLATLDAMGAARFRRLDAEAAEKAFDHAWRKTVRRVMAEGLGWLRPIPAGELADDISAAPVPRAEGRERMAGLRAELFGGAGSMTTSR